MKYTHKPLVFALIFAFLLSAVIGLNVDAATIKCGDQFKATSPKFTVPARQQIKIQVSTNSDTELGTYELYNAATNAVVDTGRMSHSTSITFKPTIAAGTYYVKLKATAYPKRYGNPHFPYSYIQAKISY